MDYIFLPLPPVRVSTCWSRLYPSAIDKKCIQRNQRYSPFLLVLLFFFLAEVLSIRMFSAEEEKKNVGVMLEQVALHQIKHRLNGPRQN